MELREPDDLGFLRISSLEFAAGWVPGYIPTIDDPPSSRASPLQHLERCLLEALLQPPCIIGFSGGRDSSALLAVAMGVARREGLDLPIPVTKLYPSDPGTDESEWQELVIDWLGVEEWVRHEYSDELDLLGPAARQSLHEHGLLWPATAHNRGPTLEIARGGCYVDGQGGDEMLGEFRISPLTQAVTRVRPLDRRTRRDSIAAIAPRRLRRGVVQRQIERFANRPWLRPEALAWYLDTGVQDVLGAALSYPKALRQMASRRAVQVSTSNLDAMGRSLGVTYVHPFYDRDFIAALGSFGGQLGFPNRTATMRALFSDILPDALNAREGKVYFNSAFVSRHSREFLDGWNGTGLDTDLVDVDVLREVWREPTIHGGTFQLLQAAWLAGQGARG